MQNIVFSLTKSGWMFCHCLQLQISPTVMTTSGKWPLKPCIGFKLAPAALFNQIKLSGSQSTTVWQAQRIDTTLSNTQLCPYISSADLGLVHFCSGLESSHFGAKSDFEKWAYRADMSNTIGCGIGIG